MDVSIECSRRRRGEGGRSWLLLERSVGVGRIRFERGEKCSEKLGEGYVFIITFRRITIVVRIHR